MGSWIERRKGLYTKVPRNGALISLTADTRFWNFFLKQDKFEGQMLHSMEHKSALDHVGKRVVVIGSGTSGMEFISLHLTQALTLFS